MSDFIGTNLRLIRLFHDLSLTELGELVGVSKQFCYRRHRSAQIWRSRVEPGRQQQGARGPVAFWSQSWDAYQNGTSSSWMTPDAFGSVPRSWRMNSWICGW